MYIEVEPGLIAVHISPEDIERVAILSLRKKKKRRKEKKVEQPLAMIM